jgi:hypothetical protein
VALKKIKFITEDTKVKHGLPPSIYRVEHHSGVLHAEALAFTDKITLT